MPESGSSINLIKNKHVSFLDKFMSWALTVGRLIVIITEIVAVAAFIYRFSLDERLSDLHSVIKQKQIIVSLLKQDENKYRNLQSRLALASTVQEKFAKTNKIILDIIDKASDGIDINNFVLNKDRINIDANVGSTSTLKNFINSLKNYPDIKSINIDNIENKPSIGLLVTLTLTLK